MTGWRIAKARYADSLFTGHGAAQWGGRWNSPGRKAVYTASSRPLAVLEMLVNLDTDRLLDRYIIARVEFDPELAIRLDPATLPEGWDADFSKSARPYGDDWLQQQSSAVLIVPSAVISGEVNYLLNPEHPDFGRIDLGEPKPFSIDPRLLN